MTQARWVYLAQLVTALRIERADGRRIGELVAEIDQHLAESGADPVDEFGPPPELAAELVRRPGTKRPGWVPPGWLHLLGGLALLLLALPLLAPYLWDESTVRIDYSSIYFVTGGCLGAQWLSYLNHRRLDGRSWHAVTGWRLALSSLAFAVSVPVASSYWQGEFFLVPKSPYLLVVALVVPVAAVILIRGRNPVRFPEHARHLNRLKRGLFSGNPSCPAVGVGHSGERP